MIKFKKKLRSSTTFNLTETGRRILKELAEVNALSEGDVVENLVMDFNGDLSDLSKAKVTGPKGGAPSLFPGKNRGTTTAITFTEGGRIVLDSQAEIANVSRGDWIEFLLRHEAQLGFDNPKLDALMGSAYAAV